MIQLILIPALFYIGAKLSLLFAVMPEVLVMLWIPNSLLLATLLHYHTRRFVYFAALIIAAEIAADYPTFSLIEAASFGAINVLEATTAYLLLRYWRFNTVFEAPADLAKFVVAGPVIAAFASALAAAAVYSNFRGAQTGYFQIVRIWWFSDGLGLLILTPLILSLWPATPRRPAARARLHWYDGAAMSVACIVLLAFALSQQATIHGVALRPVLLLPVALYAAARFSLRTTSAVVVGIAFIVLYIARNGQQPFGPLPTRETVGWAQEFIFTMSVMSLGLTTLLSQHRAVMHELESRVRERTAELSTANTKLEKLALTDALTGLPNRRALFNLMRAEMSRHQRRRHGLAVIMFDLDHFKEVNDRYGHAAGDAVLQHVAAVTAKVIRNMDTLGRYGGEEFVLVAPEIDEENALHLAERMRGTLRSSELRLDDHALRVTASFGVAMLRADDKEPEHVLRRADVALYAAKAAGRDQVVAEV